MGTGEQELKLKATVDGAKEAARDIGEVGKATEQVGKQAGTAAQPIKDHTEEVKRGTAAGTDYISILSRIHPSLGALADVTVKAFTATGELADTEVDLKGMLNEVAKAAEKNAGALAVIGGGGAVVAAVMAIVAALRRMREEADRVSASVRAMQDALNELEGKKIEVQADLERRSAARAEGPYTEAESEQAMRSYGRLGEKAPYLTEESRKQAVLAGGADASIERLERIAVLFESPGKAWHGAEDLVGRDAASRESALDMQLEHFADQITTAIQREREQAGGSMVRRAREETMAGGPGTTANIEEYIKNLPGPVAEGLDSATLAEVVQALQGLKDPSWRSLADNEVPSATGGGAGGLAIKALVSMLTGEDEVESDEYRDLQRSRSALKAEGLTGPALEPETIRAAQMILQQLEKAAARLDEAAKTLEDGQLGTHHHTHNDKYVLAPGSASTVGKGRLAVAGD